jgi:hypothetical protein
MDEHKDLSHACSRALKSAHTRTANRPVYEYAQNFSEETDEDKKAQQK